tara:strand:+ start:4781 stop:6802 length:2022 start_codon:yes stop_codon:yes gene_type:complete
MPKMLEAARAYANRGWPIFPCRADKTPLTQNGVLDATTDIDQIEAWWESNPNANIGLDVGGAGMMVLDFDPGSDINEVEINVGKLPETQLVARSPRGGQHLFFELDDGEIVSPSASKVAKAVDVRSFNSYVLLAPSRTADGGYVWELEGKPAYRTEELVRVANSHRDKHENRHEWIIEPDLEENVADAVRWLQTEAKVAVEGQGGDATAYATAAHLRSYGISSEMALDLMWEHWNKRNVPPWDVDEFDHFETKVTNGYSYATSPPGNITTAYKAALRAQLFKAVKVTAPAMQEGMEDDGSRIWKLGRYTMYNRDAMDHIPEPTWLIEDVLPADAFGIMYAPPGSYKTFIALDWALSVASGFPIDPAYITDDMVTDPGPVLYMTGEGMTGITKRVKAWEDMHNGGDKLRNFVLQYPVPSVQDDPETIVEFILQSYDSYSLIVLDTVSRAMQGVNENEQANASLLTRLAEGLRNGAGATVLALHHTNKSGEMRGSTLYGGDADFIMALSKPYGPFKTNASDLTYRSSILFEKMKDAACPEPVEYLLAEVNQDDDHRKTLVPVSRDAAGKTNATASDASPVTNKKGAAKASQKQFKGEAKKRADAAANNQAVIDAALKVFDMFRGKRMKRGELVGHMKKQGFTDLGQSTLERKVNDLKLEPGLVEYWDPSKGEFVT